ncbi:MAG: LPS export ABC transporter permease LptF [Caulobacteraceae bacterium]
MPFIQRYLFKQMLVPTIAATGALGGVAVLSNSLQLLNLVVSERQSAMMFIRLVLYTIPFLFAFVIPITAFIAVLFALNKLYTEQEIVVCFASGMSRWEVASPVMRLAAYTALLMLVVNLWVAPVCQRAFREELFAARSDLAASLVKEGEFTDSAKGLTVYAQKVDSNGILHNLFVYQPKPDGGSATFDARTGIITHIHGVPALVMRRGSNEQFSPTGTLNYLDFDEDTLDLTPYINTEEKLAYKPSDMYLHELVFPDPGVKLLKNERKKMLAEANSRLSSPLYIPTFVMFALLAVIGGSFNRMGYARQIGMAALAALLVRLFGVTIQAACENTPWLNILQYLVPIIPGIWAARRLFIAPKAKPKSVVGYGGAQLTPLGA